MVLGHTKCGAVHATLEGKPLPGSIPMIAKAIQPAVADLLKNKKDATVNDLMNAAVEANVRYQMKQVMGSSEMLRKAQADGKLTLLMAIYDVDTGAVRFLD
jgi:carbonic anhydrase